MKTFTLLMSGLLLGVFNSSGYAQENQLTANEKQDGWQLLFDGSDMSQWRNYQKSSVSDKWQIENGALKLTEAGAGDLISKSKYEDFDLKLEWKISEGGNSGVLIMADEEGKYIYSHAPEIQILDNEKAHDNKIDTHLAGSLYDMVAVHKSALKPAGQWNQLRIKLNDKLLQVWQNGVITTNVVIGSSTWDTLIANSKFADWKGFGENRSGHIGLQDHGNVVWFKNIRIKELN
ncbi:DUF1080 domain-containing protein [Alteromonas pelagimontana]|uniref:DUF1080 domain-containing protein n=1 Tax=Alteromonas pelagimontana TaxID=1858656 RepID=A0A6M4MAV8_9ALTE|nr:DUF1080 domain-containing protein [Alteromonas pelagimontana]QJR80167.1 DUF1080 domain-containing protein [Alteromonas pelagimontana]